MELKNLIELMFGLIWGIGMFVLWRRNRSKPEIWPYMFGIGGGTYTFILLMTGSILRGQKSEFLQDTLVSFGLSLVIGLVGYFSGRKLARMQGKK